MASAAAGQAALRHPPPATAAKAEHRITPGVTSRITTGHRFTAATGTTALRARREDG
jgi:hypothetical protein